MADPEDQHDELDVDDTEAERLLADAVTDDDQPNPEPPAQGDKDWKAEAEKWRKLSRQNETTAKQNAAKLRQYEDANKSEAQRLQEALTTHQTRAEKAEAALRRREIAEQVAPDHATARQIAQVAKRMAGMDDDALEADARELFDWIAPTPAAAPKTPSRPKERLRGGAEPDEAPQENDPRKLAAMIPRRR
jgi:hypothetical protein